MIRQVATTAAFILAGALAACGSSSPATTTPGAAGAPGAAPQGREVADGQHLTDFQKSRLLGHYSTYDGKSGFVLDRTVEPPKARLDGAAEVYTLTKQGSTTGAYELVNPSGHIWLRIDESSGEVLLFDGPQQTEGVEVMRDADAEQLK